MWFDTFKKDCSRGWLVGLWVFVFFFFWIISYQGISLDQAAGSGTGEKLLDSWIYFAGRANRTC